VVRKFLLSLSLSMICFAASIAVAQQKVPPPPKPPDEGPSLADTMQFIQSKLPHTFDYLVYSRDGATGGEETFRLTDTLSDVAADPQTCSISYHWTRSRDQKPPFYNATFKLDLSTIERLTVVPAEQDVRQIDADRGRNDDIVRVNPSSISLLKAFKTNNPIGSSFYISDGDLADRLAKAMTHAVELCKPGKKSEPF
jgi:hypothetical protein